MKHLKYLNKYFWKYRWRFILGVLFVAVSNYFGILSPQVIRYSFDLVKENLSYYNMFSGFSLQDSFYSLFSSALLFFGITVLLLAVLKGVFMFFMRQTLIVMSRLIEYDLKNEMYQHYQQLSLAFYKRNNTGDLMSRITEDVSRVRMYVGPAVMYAVNLLVLVVMCIYAMLSVNVELTLYVLIPLPALAISIYYVNSVIEHRSETIQKKLSELTTSAQEFYSGIRVIKTYVQESQILKFFEHESENYREEALKLARVEAFFFPLMLLLIGLSTILTIWIGGIGVMKGQITPGNIAEFVIYVNMLTWPVTAIGWVASMTQRAAGSQKRINEFLSVKPEIISDNENGIRLTGLIEFKNVSFTYPDTGIQALKDVSFKVKPGQKLAIIGKTGSGKTTIADLLVRMYDATEGEILLDGMPIGKLNISLLRKQIGYVPQDVFLFSDTVENNVGFGSDRFSRDEVIEAAKNASVHHDIAALQKQYDTIVGERGVTLSGGQKQRISLARAFLKNPQIMILDDCLSAVDAKTEQAILSALGKLLQNKTSIIITHRIFTLLNFDHIIVLDNGHIMEEGTHDELLARRGLYYNLYEAQKLEEKEEWEYQSNEK
ncbi:MAG TPA: ABC transporter ATP-binding protein [Chitinophagales bacterium]|nr:ABC transporter ATP-binding protein [Chitinophagales bacterium]